jgi:hypothetical protein
VSEKQTEEETTLVKLLASGVRDPPEGILLDGKEI